MTKSSTPSLNRPAKLNTAEPIVKKYINKLEAIVAKLEATTSELEIDNSTLRIDNRRLHQLVRSLETDLSNLTPPSEEDTAAAVKKAEKALSDMSTAELVEHLQARIKQLNKRSLK